MANWLVVICSRFMRSSRWLVVLLATEQRNPFASPTPISLSQAVTHGWHSTDWRPTLGFGSLPLILILPGRPAWLETIKLPMKLEDSMKLIDYQRAGRPILDIDLGSPPGERWIASTRQTGDQLQALVSDLLASIGEWLAGIPRMLRPLVKAALGGATHVGGHMIGTVARWCGGEYEREIASIARTAGLPYPQVLLANLIYDLSQLNNRWSAIAGKLRHPAGCCSSYSCVLPDGSPVLARNMDWDLPESIGRHTMVYRFHRGRDHYLSVGVVGLVGVLSAMRPGHWAVTLNQAPAERLGINYTQWPATQRLRAVCDQLGSYRRLMSGLQEFRSMSPFFAHVVGVRPRQQVVVNCFGAEFSTRRTREPALIQTNHFVEPSWQQFNGPETWEQGGIYWI